MIKKGFALAYFHIDLYIMFAIYIISQVIASIYIHSSFYASA